MSKISIKTDFVDGNTLPAQDLNNNFGVIETAFNHNEEYYEDILAQAVARLDQELESITANRGWDWNGSTLGQRVVFFKGTTEEIEAQPIINGQTLYNTDTGETAIDSDGKRINTGSGNVIAVQEEEPENDATKLWIEGDLVESPATEVVDNMEGEDTNLAPSVRATKEYIDASKYVVDTLYKNDEGTRDDITLEKSVNDYYKIEIQYYSSYTGFHSSTVVLHPMNKLIETSYLDGKDNQIYITAVSAKFEGNRIIRKPGSRYDTYNKVSTYLDKNNETYPLITDVIGYRIGTDKEV